MADDDDKPSKKREGVERIMEKYQISYGEICLFEETGDIFLFNKKNCKVTISVCLMADRLHPVDGVFDKGSRQDFIREDILVVKRLQSMQVSNRFSLRNTTSHNLSFVGTIMLHVRMDDSRVSVAFSAVHNFTVPVLVSSSLIDRLVKGFLPPERKIASCISK